MTSTLTIPCGHQEPSTTAASCSLCAVFLRSDKHRRAWGGSVLEEMTPRPTLQVESRSAGIGDHLLALAISEGLRRKYTACEIVFCAASWVHPWLRLFGGYDRLVTKPLKVPSCHCDNTGDWPEFTDRGLSRWEFWGEKFGVTPTLPAVVPVPTDSIIPYVSRIVLSPFAAYKERTLPIAFWLEVEDAINRLGLQVVLLDSHPSSRKNTSPDRLAPFKSEGRLIGRPATEVAAVLRSALCFVGNDSGMAHVAGMSGVRGVCVPTAASDLHIMGLYPTITALPDASPVEVVKVILGHVRAGVPEYFPTVSFLETIFPVEDKEHAEASWPSMYAVLWNLIHKLSPRTVVEIGTRAGQSSWTILDASPGCVLHTIDLPSPGPGGLEGAGTHARQLHASRSVIFHEADSQTLDRLPLLEPDLVYIDGDHTEEACFSDLLLAERSGARKILLDDYVTEGVRNAVQRFLATRPGLSGEFFPSQTGLFLITTRGVISRHPPCIYLGEPTGETAICPVCPNNTDGKQVPIFACTVHNKTTGERLAPGIKSCTVCRLKKEGYTPSAVPALA